MLRFFICAILSATPAVAGTINYTLTSRNHRVSFSELQQPVAQLPCAFSHDCFSTYPIDVTIDGSLFSSAIVSFYTPANSGALTILQGSTVLVNNGAVGNLQIFSGGLSNPTLFEVSNLQLFTSSAGSPQFDEAFVLNAVLDGGASSGDVPEASTWVLSFCALLTIILARALKYRTLDLS